MAVEGDFYAYIREWIITVDRGGLFHVNDSTFLFYRAVEVTRQSLLPHHLQNSSGNRIDGLHRKIAEEWICSSAGQWYQLILRTKQCYLNSPIYC